MSNYLNFAVKDRTAIKKYIMMQLGWPLVQPEIYPDQLEACINDAVEIFSEYVIQEKKFFAVNLEFYNEHEEYIQLPENIQSVVDIRESGDVSSVNTLFSVPNQMANAGAWYVAGSGNAADWSYYEISMQYIDLIKRLTASKYTYEYNPRNQRLTLYPNPKKIKSKGFITVGAYTIRSDDQMYGEKWVKDFAVAKAKQIVGTVRMKYAGTALPGGGTIDTSLKEEGRADEQMLIERLRGTYITPFFVIG